jgi:IS5 family transposase
MKLRQSYVRVGKLALIKSQRYAHAKQFRRHRRQVKFLRIRLGRVIRDIARRSEGNAMLEAALRDELHLARRVRDSAAATTRTQGLFAARAGNRMHRQRQGAQAL